MKRFLSLIIVPLMAIMCLCACGKDRTFDEIKKLYEETTQIYIVEEDNKFFAKESAPNSLTIKYSEIVSGAIGNTKAVTNLQKQYVVLGYQQKLLDYIYNYYESNCENFYKEISSAKVDKSEINNLYSSLENLNNALNDFKKEYNTFCSATEQGIASVMEFNLTNYSYELNKIIEKSFDFVYKFIDLNEKYCVKNYDYINTTNLELKIDKTYVDIAYIIYLTNFKAFDFSVGAKGISDMSVLVSNTSEYVLTDDLQDIRELSSTIMMGLDESSSNYNSTKSIVDEYLCALDVFNQRIATFKQLYNSEDIYNITMYKFDLVSGVSFDNYLETCSKTKQATINFMDEFVLTVYKNLVNNLSLMTV